MVLNVMCYFFLRHGVHNELKTYGKTQRTHDPLKPDWSDSVFSSRDRLVIQYQSSTDSPVRQSR